MFCLRTFIFVLLSLSFAEADEHPPKAYQEILNQIEDASLRGQFEEALRFKNPLSEAFTLYLDAKKDLFESSEAEGLNKLETLLEKELDDPLLKSLLYEFGFLSIGYAENPWLADEEKAFHLKRAFAAFKRLIELGETEKGWIALGKTHLAHYLSGLEASDCTLCVSSLKKFQTPEALNLAFILETESLGDFKKKEALYSALVSTLEPFFQEYALLRINNLSAWGAFCIHKGLQDEGINHIKRARGLLLELLKGKVLEKFKQNAIFLFAGLTVSVDEGGEEALFFLNSLKEDNPLKKAYLALFNPDPADMLKLIETNSLPKGILFLMSSTLFKKGFFKEAEDLLHKARLQSPEALFLRGLIAEKQHLDEDKRKFLRTLIDRYPNHALADEAGFIFYTLPEYLSGGRAEIKHLEEFVKKRKSFYLPLAYYILGLDFKRDRKNKEGKWIRKKSLTAAIDAFAKVQSTYEVLLESCKIPIDKEDFYSQLALIAGQELGECNYEIAKESKGAKKQLYLEYSKEILTSNTAKLESSKLLPEACLESKLLLAEVLIELNEVDMAEKKIQEIIGKREQKEDYFFSKANRLLAASYIKKNAYQEALESLESADVCEEGFSTEELLTARMQKGFCLKALGKLDEAMKAFSSVVNANAVSGIRIEGMFERAAIYKDQNRYDLYRKQLEAIIKIGGTWKSKACQLLEQSNEHTY